MKSMLTQLTFKRNVSDVNIRRYPMNIAIAILGALIMAATPALAAGFQQVTVPHPQGPPIGAGIWYPSAAPASPQRLGLFQQTVATGGAVAGRGLPLVVISHGTGGSFEGHYDAALALAEAGFVVAAVTHTGDNYRDQSQFGPLQSRPRHIKALIDFMLAAWPQHDVLEPSRIGMFGFSAGGFTALVGIGGVPNMSKVGPFCAAHPDDWGCRMRKERDVKISASPSGASYWVHDPRIAAAVIAAPAVGYAF